MNSACETEMCFFCNQHARDTNSWHYASTFELDARVRKCALQLQEQHFLAKLSAGDPIAQEAKYHVQCLVSVYNKARQAKVQVSDEMEDNTLINPGIALAEPVSYIEDAHTETEALRVFKLADLTRVYTTRLEQLGINLQAHKKGRDVSLVLNKDVGPTLRKTCDHDADNAAIHPARIASIVRRNLFKMETSFIVTFDCQCQESSVPNSLMTLVSMTIQV
ncbi:hypothetical protein Hamer_G008456, partial [Homarus americanus]